MRKLTSRETFLLVAVLAVATLGWIYGRGGGLGGGSGKGDELAKLDYGDPPVVQLARLELDTVGFDSRARNLFSYYTPPPKPGPKLPPRVVNPQPPRTIPPPVQQNIVRPPTAKPKPPSPSFRYIGFLGPKDNKIAVLEKGDEILLAAVGEVIEGHYKLVDFKYEALIIGYTSERWAGETTELPMKR